MENKCNAKNPCPQDQKKAGWFHSGVVELEKIDDTQTEWVCLHCGYTYIDKSRNWPSYEDGKYKRSETEKPDTEGKRKKKPTKGTKKLTKKTSRRKKPRKRRK